MREAEPEAILAARQVAIHRALQRPALLWGAERILTLANLGLAFEAAVLSDFRLGAIVVILGLAAAFQVLAARVAARDPEAFRIYLRSLRQQDYYPARARHDAPAPPAYP